MVISCICNALNAAIDLQVLYSACM